jgi:chromosome segregation ATPase
MVEVIRRRHEQLLEAEIQLIEARSDVECLEERNMDIVEKRNHERAKVKEIEKEANIVKETARKALRVCQAITAAEDQDTSDKLTALPEDLTLEALELDIAAEESKLDFIQANNPNAIAQFERFQGNVDKLKAKIAEVDQRLENLQTKITRTRGKWEPELDKLIAEISDAFAYNFEQIGCAGEVSVSKTDDFEEWAILIRVKFRYFTLLSSVNES